MLIAARVIKTLIVLTLGFCGGLLVLLGSGVDLNQAMQGRIGANATVGVGVFLDTLLHDLRLANFEIASGVLLIALALLVALYRT